MRLSPRIIRPFAILVERYYPDPLVIVILLTGVTAAAAMALTPASPVEILQAWGEGLPKLMTFIGQVSLMLVGAHALAHTGPVARALGRLARLPRAPWQAYGLVALVSGLASLFVWSFGIVGGAVIARQVAIEGARRGLRLHYPLIVASAYAGFSVWHMGYSGSAPLFVATEGHALEVQMGIVPVSQTILAGWNLVALAVALATISLLCPLMRPRPEDAIEAPEAALGSVGHGPAQAAPTTPAQWLENQRALNLVFGAALAAFLAHWFWRRGLDLNLNIVIWSILALLFLLSRSPRHLIGLIGDASRIVGPVLIQYPFYAGIMGLMGGTGLVAIISGWFVAIATPETLTFWAFLSGGFVNLFVPSGGGQWVVQGPVFIEAANALGVEPARIVMAIAYGDQWTNLIQPFWAVPLLAIAGLSVRQILGYCFIVLFALFFVYAGTLYLIGPGG